MEGETPNVSLFDWNTLLWEPIRQNGEKLAGFLPHLINAVYILVLGWIIAFAVQFVARKALKHIHFDKIAEKTGIAGALSESEVTTKPAEWASRMSFWVVMLVVIVKSLYELRLADVSLAVDIFSNFIFQSVGLLAIFIIGLFMSVVLAKIVYTTSVNLKVKSPHAYSRFMKWAVLVFMIVLILRQIMIPMNLVFMIAGGVFASLCVAFVIAFGVGGTGWAAKILEKISK